MTLSVNNAICECLCAVGMRLVCGQHSVNVPPAESTVKGWLFDVAQTSYQTSYQTSDHPSYRPSHRHASFKCRTGLTLPRKGGEIWTRSNRHAALSERRCREANSCAARQIWRCCRGKGVPLSSGSRRNFTSQKTITFPRRATISISPVLPRQRCAKMRCPVRRR